MTKIRLQRFRGIGVFGAAYEYMLKYDTHAAGSVDRVLVHSMVRLCSETQCELYSTFTSTEIWYEHGARLKLEQVLSEIAPPEAQCEERVSAIGAFTQELGRRAEKDLSKLQVGGTEEEIIERGSDWCTDVARVACSILQIAGIPSRIVYLFNLGQAYSGHAIVEAYRSESWGAVDSSTGVVYRESGGKPASVWELMNHPDLIEAHSGPSAAYTTVEQFQAAGIANYFCWENERYDFTVSDLNWYYGKILEMSDQGWPGGLRWLYGEDGGKAELPAPSDAETDPASRRNPGC